MYYSPRLNRWSTASGGQPVATGQSATYKSSSSHLIVRPPKVKAIRSSRLERTLRPGHCQHRNGALNNFLSLLRSSSFRLAQSKSCREKHKSPPDAFHSTRRYAIPLSLYIYISTNNRCVCISFISLSSGPSLKFLPGFPSTQCPHKRSLWCRVGRRRPENTFPIAFKALGNNEVAPPSMCQRFFVSIDSCASCCAS